MSAQAMKGIEIAEQTLNITCRAPFAEHESLVNSPDSPSVPPPQSERPKPISKDQNAHIKLIWPVFYPSQDGPPSHLDGSVSTEVNAFIAQDISLERLNDVKKLLWFVGNVGGRALSLVECLENNRSIKLTHRADMHVVTHFHTIFLKPLPDYLLCYQVWTEHICTDLVLYQDANTLLCSYTNVLILSKSDLRIAHAHGLINEKIDWEQWTAMARGVNRSRASRVVSIRWIYGELRLARLNWIYRCTHLRIYHKQDSQGWLIGTLVYVTIVLTAMQVGLGTKKLQNSLAFQRASYGFTVFSIVAPVIVLFCGWGFNGLRAIKRRAASKIASDRFEQGLRRQFPASKV